MNFERDKPCDFCGKTPSSTWVRGARIVASTTDLYTADELLLVLFGVSR